MTNQIVKLEQDALRLQNEGKFELAVELYQEIIEINPNHEFGSCFYNLACCFEELGKLEKARENYLKAIEYDNEDEYRWGGFASFLYLHGDPKEAFNAYMKLLEVKKLRNLDTKKTVATLIVLGKKIGLTEKEVDNKLAKIKNHNF